MQQDLSERFHGACTRGADSPGSPRDDPKARAGRSRSFSQNLLPQQIRDVLPLTRFTSRSPAVLQDSRTLRASTGGAAQPRSLNVPEKASATRAPEDFLIDHTRPSSCCASLE